MKNHQLEEGGSKLHFSQIHYEPNKHCYQDIDTDIVNVKWLKPILVDFLVLQTLFLNEAL